MTNIYIYIYICLYIYTNIYIYMTSRPKCHLAKKISIVRIELAQSTPTKIQERK